LNGTMAEGAGGNHSQAIDPSHEPSVQIIYERVEALQRIKDTIVAPWLSVMIADIPASLIAYSSSSPR
jgi:hypothetical protein